MKKCGLLCGVKLHSDNFEEGETMNAKQTAVILKQLDFDFVELTGGNNEKPEFSIARSVTRCREAASLPGMYKACVTIVASPAERSRLQHRPGNW